MRTATDRVDKGTGLEDHFAETVGPSSFSMSLDSETPGAVAHVDNDVLLAEIKRLAGVIAENDPAKHRPGKRLLSVVRDVLAEMAKEHSLSPEAERGGHLGPFPKGGMPAVFEYAFHMKKGDVSEVLKSNYGYHIIMLTDIKAPRQPRALISSAQAGKDTVLANPATSVSAVMPWR